MCGITGFLAGKTVSSDMARDLVQRMADSLAHRGPDDRGVWAEGPVALGHRRLSILDISPAGAQPMVSACGRLVIAYNGEIYNHLDLRRELEEAGAAPVWQGHSDTETLLAGIVHWGLNETLVRTRGMFALALWDKRERKLSLARDRIGEKPLYWGWAGRDLVFGSELKALRQHPELSDAICRDALAQYVQFAYVPAPRSIHPGVYKLEPGTVLEVSVPPAQPPSHPLRPGESHGSLSIRRYWSLNELHAAGHEQPFQDEGTALEALETTLKQAVSRQMIADVPLGAFLSGGIDSSLIVALMQEQSNRPVKTFTMGFDEDAFNEAPHAAAVAKHLGTDHHETMVAEADARAVIPLLPTLYDEPFADSSQIPTYLVCKAAREKVTVALSGDGGDELFGGYNRYFWGPRIWKKLSWMPRPARKALGRLMSVGAVASWDRAGGGLAAIGSKVPVVLLGDKLRKLSESLSHADDFKQFYQCLASGWVSPPLRDLPAQLVSNPLPEFLDSAPAAWMMAQDMRTYLPDDILCKVDRAGMGVSLETRIPFLDPDVLQISSRLPLGMKIRDGQGKWALRQVLNRRVPRELIERPKAGFGIPIGPWLRGPLRDWAEDLLSEDNLAEGGLLDPPPIRRVWAEHLSGRHDWTQRLWIILMFQAWRMHPA